MRTINHPSNTEPTAPAARPVSQPRRCNGTTTAPPVPPAVKREGYKEDLQQRIGEKTRAEKDCKVQKICSQHYRPADKQASRRKPDANHRSDGARDLKPVLGQVIYDCSPVHYFSTSFGRRWRIAAHRSIASNNFVPPGPRNQRACPTSQPS